MINAKFTNADKMDVSVTITKPLRWWRDLRGVLESGDISYTATDLSWEIRSLIEKVEQTFANDDQT